MATTEKSINYEKITQESEDIFCMLTPEIKKAIQRTLYDLQKLIFDPKDKCIEVSQRLCDEINKVELNSAIVVCCLAFWRNDIYSENDLHAYLAHQFVLYINGNEKYFIDLTLRQFDKQLPVIFITTVEKGHLGSTAKLEGQGLHQTYPEIIDLNYKGLRLQL